MPKRRLDVVHERERVFAGRSNLLTNVRMGRRWRRQTSYSFRVCDSTPFAASITITTLSAAMRAL
jgi:hypothetical protein